MIKILRTSAGKILRTQRFEVKYGKLYNYYAATDARKITSSDDWVVPTIYQFQSLADYLGASGDYLTNIIGGKLKETGFTYWDSPNTNATNEVGFNGRGGGWRVSGIYAALNNYLHIWTTSVFFGDTSVESYLVYNSDVFRANSMAGQERITGMSIRLLYTGSGTPTSYTGNDGKVYRVVQIGTQYWLADNLAETRFRNGDIIPYHGADNGSNFTNAEWAALTTAGVCAYDNDETNAGTWTGIKSILRRLLEDVSNYGLLYNEYTIEDSRKITSSDDWSVFSAAQYNAMCVAIGGYSVAGGKLKETGATWWNSPNTGATDEYNFHGRGTGYRLSTGEFATLLANSFIWTTTPYGGSSNISASITNSSASSNAGSGSSYKSGLSIRLVKDATGVPDGSRTFYTGNNGRVYSAIAINGLYWLQQALAETRFRNGDIIPWYGADAANFFTTSEWAALTTAGCAAFNNDVANVAEGFGFPV